MNGFVDLVKGNSLGHWKGHAKKEGAGGVGRTSVQVDLALSKGWLM